MAIWKDNTAPRPAPAPTPSPQEPKAMDTTYKPETSPAPAASPYEAPRSRSESLIAQDITIEGKIEGAGSVRIAGKFKGDVNVQGDLTIEAGAKLTGSVRAEKVTVAGELEGNVESAAQINVLATGAGKERAKLGVGQGTGERKHTGQDPSREYPADRAHLLRHHRGFEEDPRADNRAHHERDGVAHSELS